MKRTFVALYFVAIHAALAVALLRPEAIQWRKQRLGVEPVGIQYIRFMQGAHLTGDTLVPSGAFIFLGDSNTQAMPVSAAGSFAVNYGVGYQTTEQLAEFLPALRSVERASAIHLSTGTNDIRDGESAELESRFKRVLSAIPDDVQLLWSGIIPGRRSNSDAIRDANATARSMCEARPRCTYIDTWEFLAGSDGAAIPELYQDAVHVNAEGYRLWLQSIRSAYNVPTANSSHR